MAKKRVLQPESMYARHHLETWLRDEIGVTPRHRHRIWKHYQETDDSDNNGDTVTADLTRVPDLPNVVMDQFSQHFVLTTSRVVEEKASEHGRKLVVQLQDDHLIETVVIQHTKNRSTVCVSSQVGCQMGCTFCATGTLGKIANLTAAEIVEQVHHARQRDTNNSITGVVFMGMGEPLDNYDNVLEAIQSLAEPSVLQGHPIPFRRTTLSTVGVVPAIKRLAKDCPQIQLALSLHAPNDIIRQQIVPTSKAYSISKIMNAIDLYQQAGKRSVMMEYIMIQNVNSSVECAHELGRLLQGRECIVNLIPYNPTEAGDQYGFESPPDAAMEAFSRILYHYQDHKGKPLRCSIRWSSRRGQDMDAACGQLALKNLNSSNDGSSGGGDMEDIMIGNTTQRQRRKNTLVPTKKGTTTRKIRKVGKDKEVIAVPFLTRYWPAMLAGAVVLGGTILLRPRRR
jgi:23S rRNA (adenine(2503)-C(2))-methyltransferase